jgi:hypothetical protein
MSAIIRLVPGIIAASAAFVALRAMDWLEVRQVLVEYALFLLVYIVVALLAHNAMKAYPAKKR